MSMIALTIYGASDDLVEVESSDGSVREEYDAIGPVTLILEAPRPNPEQDGPALEVRAEYGRRDWELTVVTVSTSAQPWPWSVDLGKRPGDDFDPALIISAPEGTTVKVAS